jgi:hypothetical protein
MYLLNYKAKRHKYYVQVCKMFLSYKGIFMLQNVRNYDSTCFFLGTPIS